VTGFTISLIHTAFNIINTIMMLPLCGVIEKLAYVIVKDTSDSHSPESLVVLDERFLSTPGVAIEQCRNVTNRMASISKNTISLSLDLFRSYDEDKAEMIVMEEETVDRYEDLIGTYLVKLSGRSLTATDNRRVSLLLHAIGDFERISDHAVNIMDSAKEIFDKELEFSSGAKRELDVLFRALEDILDLTVKAFSEQDVALAKKIEPVEEVIDHLCAEMKDRHIDRLQNKVCTIEQGFVFTDMLTNIERVSDHCSNIAVNIIQIEDVDIVRHQYLHDVKSEDNEEFVAMYDEYSLKYLLPQE
jgi:phosphate:Na+ symporter